MSRQIIGLDAEALQTAIRDGVAQALKEAGVQPPSAATLPQAAYTDPELAKTLGYSISWVRQARQKRLIRQIKVGSRYLTPADEVARLLREGCPSIGDGARRAKPKAAA